MLLNSLFNYWVTSSDAGLIEAKIKIDAKHAIFKGHFPGKPVVPGVCMIQMIKEIMEEWQESKLSLTSADNIKFLAVWSPEDYPEVQVKISITESADIGVNAVLFAGEVTFLKLKASLKSR